MGNVMANITLKQLKAFVAVAELQRFRLAAEQIGLTQSAVSILIKELESQLGTSLFDRHTRFVGLTDAGARFLPMAHEILEQVDNAVGSMDDISNLRAGRVTIAAAIVLAATYLPKPIAQFVRKHPDIRVELRDVSEAEIRELLISGEVDLGVGSSRFLEDEINEHELMSDQLALFCTKDHELAQRESIRWRDLNNQPLVSLTPENPLQKKIEEYLKLNSVSTRRKYSVRFSTTLLGLVNEGLGIGLLPQGSKGLSAMANIVMRPILDQPEPRKVVALTLRERALSPAANAFYRHLVTFRRETGE